jgi:hypothetical protein
MGEFIASIGVLQAIVHNAFNLLFELLLLFWSRLKISRGGGPYHSASALVTNDGSIGPNCWREVRFSAWREGEYGEQLGTAGLNRLPFSECPSYLFE